MKNTASQKKTGNINRRRFLRNVSITGAALWGAPMIVPRHVIARSGKIGPNDQIAVGAIGVGGRGQLLLQQLPEAARLLALSDCNVSRLKAFQAKQGWQLPEYQDYRELLERSDLDGVVIATGEFQRVVPCIHACQAGLDVYAEKPLTLYIREGRALVNAARKYDRIVQVGTQQRSMEVNRVACDLIRSGGLGKIIEVRAVNYGGSEASPSNGLPAMPVPDGLDWNMWLNQAADRPFHPDWMGWMRWRDFAGGEMTNWGAHGVDQIQWALGTDETGPVDLRPLSSGSNGQVEMRYANGVPVRFVLENGRGPMGGAIFVCEKGKLEINRNKFVSNPPEIAEELRKKVDIAEEERKWSDDLALWQARWHLQNWLDCMRTRERPVADVEIGHRSITVCHLANITRAVGRPIKWNPAQEKFEGDDEANVLLDRPRRRGFELPVLASIAWLLLGLVIGRSTIADENWSAWRGPNGNGVTSDTDLPLEWSRTSDNVRWRIPLPEPCNSTPITWNDRIFITQPLKSSKQRTLICLDRKSGEKLWQQEVAYDHEETTHETNPYCSPSPVTDGERVIVWHGSAGVYCYDMNGTQLWNRELGAVTHPWGSGASPVIHGGHVFLNFGPGNPSFIVALDKNTGNVAWQQTIPSEHMSEVKTALGPNGNAASGELYGSWSTPVVVRDGDRDLLVVTQPEQVVAYDPLTGDIVWKSTGISDLVYTTPLWDRSRLVAWGGYHGPSLAVRLGGKGDVTDSHQLWHIPRSRLRLGSGILHQDRLFVADMQGIVECMDVETQKEFWRERLAATSGDNAVWSSMVLSGDRIYMMNQSADTYVFRAADKFELLARNSLGEPTNSSPVPSQGELLLRTHEALWCISK